MIKTDKIKKSKSGKLYSNALEKLDNSKYYDLKEAIDNIQNIKYAKFNETLEIVMKLGVDPRHSDQMVRGIVSLPAGSGKNVRVAVICKDNNIEIAKAAGANLYGSTELIEEIKAGKINFDVCIASPDMMGLVGQVARILGPKGLMPNPKLGTVTTDISSAVTKAKSGQVEFRVEKQGIVHAGVGKLNFLTNDLLLNAQTFIDSVNKAKPSGSKGVYIKAIYLSSTMGPSLKINLDSITANI